MPTRTTKGATQNERLLFSAFCKEENMLASFLQRRTCFIKMAWGNCCYKPDETSEIKMNSFINWFMRFSECSNSRWDQMTSVAAASTRKQQDCATSEKERWKDMAAERRRDIGWWAFICPLKEEVDTLGELTWRETGLMQKRQRKHDAIMQNCLLSGSMKIQTEEGQRDSSIQSQTSMSLCNNRPLNAITDW